MRLAMSMVLVFSLSTLACAPSYYNKGVGLDTSGAFHERIDFEDIDYARINAAVFHATNEARARQGVEPVRHSEILQEAAQTYARRSARRRFLAHRDPTTDRLVTPEQRVAAAGADNPMVSENLATTPGLKIASGERLYVLDRPSFQLSRTPGGEPIERHTYASFARNLVEQWMNSPGHRRNLLSKDALQLGCGAALYTYDGPPNFVAVQNFQLFEPIR